MYLQVAVNIHIYQLLEYATPDENIEERKSSSGAWNIVQNNGETAGQTVMHFHLHIIPRYKDDGQSILWKPTSPTAEELAAIRDTITGA